MEAAGSKATSVRPRAPAVPARKPSKQLQATQPVPILPTNVEQRRRATTARRGAGAAGWPRRCSESPHARRRRQAGTPSWHSLLVDTVSSLAGSILNERRSSRSRARWASNSALELMAVSGAADCACGTLAKGSAQKRRARAPPSPLVRQTPRPPPTWVQSPATIVL